MDKWWIIIMVNDDTFPVFEGAEVILAESLQDARDAALIGRHENTHCAPGGFGPFDEKPLGGCPCPQVY